MFGLGRRLSLSVALHLTRLALPARARVEVSLPLAAYKLGLLVVAALLLADLAILFRIPLFKVESPLVVRVDLYVDPVAVAT